MVNCNPETVSTDYDTSDRLYFEPLTEEYVLDVCAREQPDGVVIQFGGQTPLKLAHAIAEAGYPILGTPNAAVDLAEDRERFAGLLDELEIRCPAWGIAESGEEAVAIAERIGYPVLVRPSYVLGGRAMRVCYRPEQVRDAFAASPRGKTLVDRFLEGALEIDVDAICDGDGDVDRRGDGARGGSGRPFRRLLLRLAGTLARRRPAGCDRGARRPPRARTRRRRPRERAARARGRRHVRARGEPARVAHGSLREQGDGRQPRRGGVPRDGRCRPVRSGPAPGTVPAEVSVKAAVFPFQRFPGSDPVLGPRCARRGR